ncbi:hypothetical protein D3C81_1541140 [compost metagenome]
MRPQRHQQAEFGCGEASGIAVVDNVLAVVVQHHFADIGTQRRAAIKCHAPQQGIDPCVQRRQAEGLGQVVVGTTGKATDAVLLGAQRRHQHDRHRLLPAQFVEQAEAIDTRQHDVQQHQFERCLPNGVQGLGTRGAGVYPETAFEEMAFQVLTQACVVFGEEK